MKPNGLSKFKREDILIDFRDNLTPFLPTILSCWKPLPPSKLLLS